MGAPKILQDNVFAAGLLLASSTAVGTAVAAIGDLRPFTWYRPATLPATVTVELDAARAADSALLYAHNLASMGCEVQIRGSTDAFASSDVLVATISPATDGPQWSAWSSVSYRSWRLRIDGPGTPALDLDFAGLKALPAGVTFARASIGTYFDAAGVLRTAAAGEARFTHDPMRGTSLGLMVEESRTNLVTYSEQLDNAAWIKSATTISANATTAPDGAATADKCVEAAGSAYHFINSANGTISAGATIVGSVFFKAAGRDRLVIEVADSTATARCYVGITPETGAVWGSTTLGGATFVSSFVQRLRDGWFRVGIVATLGGAYTLAKLQVALADSGNNTLYVGDGTSGAFIWGAQIEAGAGPTSYIPTAGATVTRAADSATMTGAAFSNWYNATEGTLSARFRCDGLGGSGFPCVAHIGFGTTGNRGAAFTINDGSGDSLAWNLYDNTPTYQGVPGGYTATRGAEVIAAGAYKANDSAASFAGSAASTDTSVTLATSLDKFAIGAQVTGSAHLNGTISRLTYWPRRLTNAQLQWLTAADRGTITEPSIAIAMVGTALAFPYGIEQPFDPLGREVGGRSLQNNNGEPLGAVVDFEEWEATLAFRGLSWAWVRSVFLPAWDAGLKSKPFAFAWMPDLYPGEVRLCTAASRKFTAAHGSGSLCDLSFPVRGRA